MTKQTTIPDTIIDDESFKPSGFKTTGFSYIDCSNQTEDRMMIELNNDFLDSLTPEDDDQIDPVL